MTILHRELAHDAYLDAHGGSRAWVPRPLRGYRRRWLGDDIVAGITVATLVIPLGLAFAQLAGLPPVYGLYTSILPVIAFALVASTPQAIVGAEAALSGIVAAAIAPAVLSGHDRIEAASALAIMIGVACLVGAAFRAGRLAQMVSRTVFVGYLAGVAVSVIVGQLPRLVGADSYTHDTLAGQITELPRVVGSADAISFAIGSVTAIVVLVSRRLASRAPAALVMLIVSAVTVWALGLEDKVTLIGDLPDSVPGFVIPHLHLDDLLDMLPAALGIAVVGFADTTLVSQGFAARNAYRVNSSRDLAALGTADLLSGTFGGLPVSASSARTAAAEATGAHTQLASIVSALAIAGALLVGSDLVSWIPQPALAGIIVAVMIGIVDTGAVRALSTGRRSELAICFVAFLGVAALGVLQGVAVAIAVSVGVIVLRASHPHDTFLGERAEDHALIGFDEDEDARAIPGIAIYRIDAPLFFGNVDRLRDQILTAVARTTEPPIRHVVVAASAITDIDYTASQVLEEVAIQLRALEIEFTVAGINHELADELARTMRQPTEVTFTTAAPETVLATIR